MEPQDDKPLSALELLQSGALDTPETSEMVDVPPAAAPEPPPEPSNAQYNPPPAVPLDEVDIVALIADTHEGLQQVYHLSHQMRTILNTVMPQIEASIFTTNERLAAIEAAVAVIAPSEYQGTFFGRTLTLKAKK